MQLPGLKMTEFKLPGEPRGGLCRTALPTTQGHIRHDEKNLIPQRQPFKRKENSHKDSCSIFLNIPVQQNDLTDFSSRTMLQNTLYASSENLKILE